MGAARRSVLLLASVALLASGGSGYADGMAMHGAGRDADGRFLNLAGPLPFAGPAVTWPFFARRVGTTLTGRSGWAASVANDGAFLRENARHSAPTVTWIGHATVLVQMDHRTFLTDPIWSERASPLAFAGPKRAQAPGVALDDLPPIDFVLISHDHYDHLDVATLAALAARRAETRFVTTLGNAALLRDAGVKNVVELDWNQATDVAGLEVVCLPAQHWSGRGAFDQRSTLWGSYAVVGPQHRFFFAGDSGYFAGFATIGAEYGPFDLVAVPIGAYAPAEMMHFWHMNPEEALQAARDLRARHVLPVHYGTFDLSDEDPAEPPRRFVAAADAGALPRDAVYLLRIGETRGF